MLGVAYYPEHWGENRVENDLNTFINNGIEIIRIGEFAWDIFEPEEGIFNFDLFDKVFNISENLGLKIIFGTPSATPPAWLIRKYPEILQRNRDGSIRNFGSRRHYCFSSDIYKEYISKLLEKIIKRYKDSKSLYAWQIDNEFGCEGTTYCYCEKCDEKFRKYLKNKYITIENLNKAWGTVFWSQMYNSFDQIETPKQTNALPNPHQYLDFYRFTTKNIIEFSNFQEELIRKYSNKAITHNFMVNFTEIDYFELAKQYDFVSYDSYIPSDIFNPALISMNYSLMYSLKRKPFTIMELQPGRVNWQKRNWYYPYEILKCWIYQGFLHNADDILIFRDRALSFGAEQYHNAILNYNGKTEDSPRLKILHDFYINKEEKKIKGNLNQFNKDSGNKYKVGIYFDYENSFIHSINSVSKDFSYIEGIFNFYEVFKSLGFIPEFIFKNEENLNKFDILIFPYAIYLDNEIKEKIKSFKNYLIVTCMTDIKDQYNRINLNESLIKVFRNIEFKIIDFGAIKDFNFSYNGMEITGDYWIERLEYKGKDIIVPFIISEDKKTLYLSSCFNSVELNKIIRKFIPSNMIPIYKLKKIFKNISDLDIDEFILKILNKKNLELFILIDKIYVINYNNETINFFDYIIEPYEIIEIKI
ncbi:MAG: beta-galactosidase [Spirochaetes bacterium]|nr:beta-galactosidase [Spirochaetota bacterium]